MLLQLLFIFHWCIPWLKTKQNKTYVFRIDEDTTENYSVVPAARQLRGKISKLLQKHQWRLTTHPGEMCSKGDRLSNTASSAAALATPAPLDVMRETKPSLEIHLFLHYTASFYSPCLPSGHPRQVEKIKQFRKIAFGEGFSLLGWRKWCDFIE